MIPPEPRSALFRREAMRAHAEAAFGSVVIASPPAFTVLTLAVLALVLALALFLHFGRYTERETVAGYVAVASGDVRVLPQTAGVVTRLFVREGQTVLAGDPLFALGTWRGAGRSSAAAGEVVAAIEAERSALESLAAEQLAYFDHEGERLRRSAAGILRRIGALRQQEQLARRKLELARAELERLRPVALAGHIPARDLERLASALLEHELSHAGMRLQLSALEAGREDADARLAQLPHLERSRSAEIAAELRRTEQRLSEARAGLAQGVVAPIGGTVTGLAVKQGQTVSAQTPALSIVPRDARFHAELLVPGRSLGRLDERLELQLRFEAYPYERYGLYSARIVSIARSPMLPGDAEVPVPVVEPVYRVRAELAQQEVMLDGTARSLAPGMALQADILLDERSLFEWLIRPLSGVSRRL
ncbi:MAG: HlyD family secretion protein [Woeseiaceae bacterium]